MRLHKWSDTLAKSKLSPERRARIQAEVVAEARAHAALAHPREPSG
ncbi:MAG TPA: hypothetical protein VI356_02635 [Myxococcales bacterium]